MIGSGFEIHGELHDNVSIKIKEYFNIDPVWHPVQVCRDLTGQIFVKWCGSGWKYPPTRADHKALVRFCESMGYVYAGPDIGEDVTLDDFKEVIRRATGSQKYVDEVLSHVGYSKLLYLLDDTVRPADVILGILEEVVVDHVAQADYTRRMSDMRCDIRDYLEPPAEIKKCCTFNYLPVREFTGEDWHEVLETDENVKGIEHGFRMEVSRWFPGTFDGAAKDWILNDFEYWPHNVHARLIKDRAREVWHKIRRWYEEYDCPWQMTIRQYLLACEDPSKVRTPDGGEWDEDTLREVENINCDTVEGLAAQFELKEYGKKYGLWSEGYKGFHIHLNGYLEPTHFSEDTQGLYCAVGGGYVRFDSSPGMMKIREEILQAARMVLPGNQEEPK